MAVYLANTSDGGTATATVSTGNSGGTSGPAWDSVVTNTGAGASITYDTAHVLGGHPLAIKCSTGATSTSCYVVWSTSLTATSLGQTWFRLYLYFAAIPGGNVRVWSAFNGATLAAAVQVLSSGKLRVLDTSAAAISPAPNTVIPVNQWFRIEGFVTASATVGQTELRLYSTYDAAPQNYTEISTSTATQNTSAAITLQRFGIASGTPNVAAYWQASMGASDTGYLGPEAPVTAAPQSAPAPPWLGRLRPAQPWPRSQYQGVVPGQRVIPLTLPATATAAGTLQDAASKALTATATASGTQSVQAGKPLAGSVATAGTVVRGAGRALQGTVTSGGTLGRQAGKAVGGSATAAGSLGRQAGKPVTVTATAAGAVGRQAGKALPGAVTAAGTVGRAVAFRLPAAAAVTGSVTRQVPVVLAATVTAAGSLLRRIGRLLRGTVTGTGTVSFPPPPLPPGAVTVAPAGPLAATVTVTSAQPAAVDVAPAGNTAARVIVTRA